MIVIPYDSRERSSSTRIIGERKYGSGERAHVRQQPEKAKKTPRRSEE